MVFSRVKCSATLHYLILANNIKYLYNVTAMFTREKKFTNKDGSTRIYLQLAETIRDGDKVRQKIVANLGRLDHLQDEKQIDKLIEGLLPYTKKKELISLLNHSGSHQEAIKRWDKIWGPVLIYQAIWKELGLDRILKEYQSKSRFEFDINASLFAMVLNRLVDPDSKSGVHHWIQGVYEPSFASLSLQHFYRGLDFLAEHKEPLENELFTQLQKLYAIPLHIVFWDTTSTYFEGEGPESLAKFGFSKDNRSDRVQIVIGLLVTEEGIPLAHEIFPGNLHDTKSMLQAFAILKERFQVKKIILVGDRGMVSNAFLSSLDEQGYEYIVGMKMRKLKHMQRILRSEEPWETVEPIETVRDTTLTLRTSEKEVIQKRSPLQVQEVFFQYKRYVICLNPQEASYDQTTREIVVQKLQEKLNEGGVKSLIANAAYKRFVKVEGTRAQIDQEVISAEALYDGKYILHTNNQTLSAKEIALNYKHLWRVERSFRELKSTLDLRPIFHWSEPRVRGHVMVCVLSYLLESLLRKKLKDQNIDCCFKELMKDLQQIQASLLVYPDGRERIVRAELPGQSYLAFQALKITPPVLSKEVSTT